jgi:hypothetical protein
MAPLLFSPIGVTRVRVVRVLIEIRPQPRGRRALVDLKPVIENRRVGSLANERRASNSLVNASADRLLGCDGKQLVLCDN